MLKIDIDTLESQGKIKWEDKLKCTIGATHVKYHNNTDMIGVCTEVSATGSYQLTAYKITPQNI